MYVYIYLIRREGLELRWEVRREGFLTYDFYSTRCKFWRREEPKTCVGWDFYDVCSNKIYVGWAFFTSGGLFLRRVDKIYIEWFIGWRFFTSGGEILHRVQTTFTSGFPQSHVATRWTMIIDNIDALDYIDERQRSKTIIHNIDERQRSTTTKMIIEDIDERQRSTTAITIIDDH